MKARLASPVRCSVSSMNKIRNMNRRGFTVTLACLCMFIIIMAVMVRAPYSSAQTVETISTFASDCTTPQTIFHLGDTVCAEAADASIAEAACSGCLPFPTAASGVQRRFEWVTPDGNIFGTIGPDIITPTQSTSIIIPATGPLAQRGTWTVKTIDTSNNGHAVARFVVQDPDNAAVDLWCPITAPFQTSPQSNALFTVFVTNKGPNDAANVELTVTVATNATFQDDIQVSGPTFTCTDPEVGAATGSSTCTISSLPANTTAQFSFVFKVNTDAQAGAGVTSTASVSSDTDELFSTDNTFTATVTIASQTCEVSCPPDVTQLKDTGQCGKVVDFGTPTGSGTGCGTVVCSPPGGSVFPLGTTNVVCSGATGGSCSFTVTIQDTGTSINCPANISLNEGSPGFGSAVVNYAAPTFPDACAVPAVACTPPSGSSFPVGTTTVNCQTTNNSNSPLSCSFTVTINSLVCILNCIDDVFAVENPAGSHSAAVSYASPTSSGCPSLTITCVPPSGSSFPLGATTVNCSGKDGSNNTLATCSFTVRVNAASTCTIICPANITRVADAECANDSPPPPTTPCTTVTYAPTTTGGCTPTCAPPSGSSFGVGTTIVHCSVTDAGGNTSSCSFTVTVTGGTPCTIICPSVPSQPSDPAGCTKVVTYSDPTTSGSCGDPNGDPDHPNPKPFSCNPPSGSIFPVGTTTVTCTTDVGTECSFNVVITGTDTVAPVITTCATPTFALADSTCQAPVPNVTTDVEATDNCTPAELLTVTQNPVAGTLVGTGTTTITLTVKDAKGNSSTPCTTTFTLFESTPPTALCKPFMVALNAAGTASITAADVDNGSTDNCAIATRTVSPSTFTCANKGPNTVTLTVTDPSGNSASCQATVTVVDIIQPTITCPANVVQSTDPNQCTAVVTYANATAADNCSGVGTPVCTPTSGSAFAKGITTVNCLVSDASGNSSSCSFTVTINDTQPPAITCLSNIIADFDPAVNGAVVTYATPVGTDNCPGATTSQIAGLASGATFPTGTTTNTFRVTDAAGLTATCSFNVTVALTSIIGLDSVSISGASLVDSYNSAGGYPATKGALANVLSNGTITFTNSGKVSGNVRSTRAGVNMSGASQITGNATAGTTVSRSGSASVGGTITNNALAPVMTLPSVPACGGPYSPNTGISGTYSYNASTGDLSLSGVNIATLANGTYCFHNVTLTNSAQLKVNGPVVIKITGTLNASGATSLSNTTGIPGNLRILSSYTGSNGVTLGNSTNVHVVIYAPNTGVSISGAAPLFGTVVGKTVTLSNSGMIHYDTLLKNIWPDIWSILGP